MPYGGTPYGAAPYGGDSEEQAPLDREFWPQRYDDEWVENTPESWMQQFEPAGWRQ